MSNWLVPLDSGRDDDLEYEASYHEKLQDIVAWQTYVMHHKQYPPFVPYQRGLDFRKNNQENK